jgi:hypothetical protein
MLKVGSNYWPQLLGFEIRWAPSKPQKLGCKSVKVGPNFLIFSKDDGARQWMLGNCHRHKDMDSVIPRSATLGKRRRQALMCKAASTVLAGGCAALAMHIAGLPATKKQRTFKGRTKAMGFVWSAFSSDLDNSEYYEAFRMDRSTMEEIVSRIGGSLQAETSAASRAINASGHTIDARQRFCASIRWFAGGQRVDILRIYKPMVSDIDSRLDRFFPWAPTDTDTDTSQAGASAALAQALHYRVIHCVANCFFSYFIAD